MERASERRAAARTAVVWEAVQHVLTARPGDPGPARVLDVGGGTGGFAVRLAGLGHEVTVVDPSPDALAALGRRAAEADVAARVTGLQGDLASLLDLVPRAGADLVLCHGVLGLLDAPAAGLATIAGALRPGGALSLTVAQAHAAVLARAMSGGFAEARTLLEGTLAPAGSERVAGERRFTAGQVEELLDEVGLRLDRMQGVRVFADLVPGSLLDLQAGATEALLELERLATDRPEYLTLAAQLHVLASLPGA
ncbi:methyltransferase [Marmoricola endophyticus]|uniref:Methyltransferase n=1 Tax=Marmoricola endophyticus TaxID=2040280 RepID=A0A917BD16_9ACTN|nr:methyltransferase [Marmoricola endophyticus]GGF38037.1 methyltransferase [Marmoricola endophyticus]